MNLLQMFLEAGLTIKALVVIGQEERVDDPEVRNSTLLPHGFIEERPKPNLHLRNVFFR